MMGEPEQLRQAFAWWAFSMNDADPVALLSGAAALGLTGVEMLPPELYPVARDVGLQLVSSTGHDIDAGFNDPANHLSLTAEVRDAIVHARDEGINGVIVFSGRRVGFSDAEAVSHMVDALTPLAAEAADSGVELWLELLNSTVDHPGQQCDRSEFAFSVARAVGSPGFKVLYDCYHMQLMEGNLLDTIKANLPLIGHVHTGGAPGRHDLDDRQEINWRAVSGLLRRNGYTGWVGHEFVPRGDPLPSLANARDLFLV